MTPYKSHSACDKRIDAYVLFMSTKKIRFLTSSDKTSFSHFFQFFQNVIYDIIGQKVILTFFPIVSKLKFSCHIPNMKSCAHEEQVVVILNAVMVKFVSTDSQFIVFDLFLV